VFLNTVLATWNRFNDGFYWICCDFHFCFVVLYGSNRHVTQVKRVCHVWSYLHIRVRLGDVSNIYSKLYLNIANVCPTKRIVNYSVNRLIIKTEQEMNGTIHNTNLFFTNTEAIICSLW
jgi:hypothetical protein